ncbi:MAG: DPP IV N-terminal domain-containing protein [Planctomycetota bacterium]
MPARTLTAAQMLATRPTAALLAVAGIALASGCSTTTSQWADSGADAGQPASNDAQTAGQTATNSTSTSGAEGGFVAASDPEGESAVWNQLLAENSETESDQPGFGSPIDLFGDVAGRGIAQGDATLSAAYDPADLSRISFSSVGADFDPVATADGNHVFFASTRHRTTADIYRKHKQSRVVTQITTDPGHDVMPAVSPDGSRLAFASNRQGNWNIYVIDAGGGQARPVTDDAAHELHASWSPDGTRLVYCRLGPVSQRWELWLVDVENPMVKHQIGFGLFPEFAPVAGTGTNGSNQIVFQRARERGSRLFSIWSMDLRGNDAGYLTELASRPDAALINPTWSRDGNRVAYASVPLAAANNNGKPGEADIWILNIDGTGETNLTADDAVNLMPAWGEQNEIFFISDRSGTDNIWSVAGDEAVLAAGEPYVGLGSRRTANSNATPAQTGTVQNSTARAADRKNPEDGLGVSTTPAVADFPVNDE